MQRCFYLGQEKKKAFFSSEINTIFMTAEFQRRVWSQRETLLWYLILQILKSQNCRKAWFDETSSFTKKENPSNDVFLWKDADYNLTATTRRRRTAWKNLCQTSFKGQFMVIYKVQPSGSSSRFAGVSQTVPQVNLAVSQRDNKEDGRSGLDGQNNGWFVE